MNSKTVALVFAMFSLGGLIAVPGLSFAPQAHAQVDAGGIVSDVLSSVGINDDDDDDNGATQNIEQPIEQEIEQEVDQSERNTQVNVNEQDQLGVIDQDIAQGIVDGDDKAVSSSESGDAKADAKKKHSRAGASSSSSSGDASNINSQDAANTAELVQDQQQTVTQSNTARFGDDTADQRAANVAIPIAVPINVQDEVEEDENGEDDLAERIQACFEDNQGFGPTRDCIRDLINGA